MMNKENWTNEQIQSVLDGFSVGKLATVHLLGTTCLRIHDQPLEYPDIITQRLTTRKQDLQVEEILAKTTHGLYLIVVVNPVEEHQVFVGAGKWTELFYRSLGLKNALAVGAQPLAHTNKCVHRFGHYFYLFAL